MAEAVPVTPESRNRRPHFAAECTPLSDNSRLRSTGINSLNSSVKCSTNSLARRKSRKASSAVRKDESTYLTYSWGSFSATLAVQKRQPLRSNTRRVDPQSIPRRVFLCFAHSSIILAAQSPSDRARTTATDRQRHGARSARRRTALPSSHARASSARGTFQRMRPSQRRGDRDLRNDRSERIRHYSGVEQRFTARRCRSREPPRRSAMPGSYVAC